MQEQVSQLLKQWQLELWAWNLIIIGAAILLGLLIKLLLVVFLRRKTEGTNEFSLFYSILRHLGKPLSYLFPVILFNMLIPILRMPVSIQKRVTHGSEIALIIIFGWLLIQSIMVVQDFIFYKYDIKKENNLRERKIRTQLQFLRRILVMLIAGITVAAVLLTFSSMRKIGTGLLTGVGVGGIIVGFAAQRSLGNLLAGLQIAVTQPIRIDDAVVVEGEFGWIEDITLTYVVVRIWDDRRLILPINYFLEKPFQNWTRKTSAMLGSVMLYADYTIPVEAVRKELERLVNHNPFWDKRTCSLAVTNLTDKSMELRAVVSARNSGDLFDLRCYVREQLVNFVKQQCPDSLPKNRTYLQGLPEQMQKGVADIREAHAIDKDRERG